MFMRPSTVTPKVMSQIRNSYCNLHTIGNYCVKYKLAQSKNRRGFEFQDIYKFKVYVAFVCLFVCFVSLRPFNNLTVKQ